MRNMKKLIVIFVAVSATILFAFTSKSFQGGEIVDYCTSSETKRSVNNYWIPTAMMHPNEVALPSKTNHK